MKENIEFPNQSNNKERKEEQEQITEIPEKSIIVTIAQAMEKAETEEEMRKYINEFIDRLPNDLHVELTDDVNSVYDALSRDNLLVRLESPSVVVKSLVTNEPLHLGGGGDHYANTVIAENEGIKIALSEGEAPGPIRLLIGFDVRSAIGFDPKGIEVHDIDIDEFDLRDTTLRSALCRHVEGNLKPENIKYLIMRIPKHFLEEKNLTDAERKKSSLFVFRVAKFSKESLAPLSTAEANLFQTILIKESGLEPGEWIKNNASYFREIITSNAYIRRLIRINPEAAKKEINHYLAEKRQKVA